MYKISISWSPSQTGGDPIIDFNVYWDQATDSFEKIAETTYGQTNLIKTLTVDGSDAGKSYYFRVSALNSLGEGELSDPYLVVAATVPDAPILLTRNDDFTSRTVVSFTWAEGTGNGGTGVIDYHIQFDQGTGDFIEIGSYFTS
jgi:hypothetical protein